MICFLKENNPLLFPCFVLSLQYYKITMAEGKFTESLIKLRCGTCKRINYIKHKNKKTVERKIEFKKYCDWCKKHTLHKESKK